MSYGIVCLHCRKYVVLKNQPVLPTYACDCKEPRYSADLRTEITKEKAEQIAKIIFNIIFNEK